MHQYVSKERLSKKLNSNVTSVEQRVEEIWRSKQIKIPLPSGMAMRNSLQRI